MRRGKVKLSWWSRQPAGGRIAPAMLAWPFAVLFIGASGMISVTFGYAWGAASGNGLVVAAVAVAIEGFVDLSVPLLWRDLRLLGRMALIAFFVCCLAYKLEAAKKFAAEQLGVREAAGQLAAQEYGAAVEKVEDLRRAISAGADARLAPVIEADIAGRLRDPKAEGCQPGAAWNGPVTGKVCPEVDRLRAELARAKARDKAREALEPALAAMRRASPSVGAAKETAGPVAGALALAGIAAGSWSQLMANLFMLIVEAGAIVVPMLIGGALGRPRRPAASGEAAAFGEAVGEVSAATSPAPALDSGEIEASPSSPPSLPESLQPDVADLARFLAERTDRAPGEKVQAVDFLAVYRDWKAERGEEPMTMQRFGVVLTRDLGLAKKKVAGKILYLDIKLRHPVQGRRGRAHLQAVAA